MSEIEGDEQVCIMLKDTKSEQERLRKANEIPGREMDRKREQKSLEKQIKEAQSQIEK